MYYVAAGVSRAELTKFDHHLWLHHHHLHQDHVDVSSSSGVRWSSPFSPLLSSSLPVCFSLSSSRSYHRSHHLASSPSPASKLMNMIMFPNTLYRQKHWEERERASGVKGILQSCSCPPTTTSFFFQVTCQSLRSTHDVMRIQTPVKIKMIPGERENQCRFRYKKKKARASWIIMNNTLNILNVKDVSTDDFSLWSYYLQGQ